MIVVAVFLISIIICAIIIYIKECLKPSEGIDNETVSNNVNDNLKEINNDLAIKIYNKCIIKKITDLDSNNIDALGIIAYSYGVKDIEEAKKYFYAGKNIFKENENEKKRIWYETKISKAREKEMEIFLENKKKADIIGKDKYTYSLKKDLEYGYKALELSKTAEKLGLVNMNARPQISDPAIWGGIANGIGGTAAGLATFMDIKKKNEQEIKNTKKIQESGEKLYNNAKDIQRYLPDALKNEELMKDYIEDKLFDDRFPEEKMKNLKISDIEYSITDGKNINVKAKYTNNDITILNSPAILDGSLKIEIYNMENCLIATGYHVAPGIEKFDLNYKGNDNFDLNFSGFSAKGKIDCICISDNYKKIDEDIEYRVEIKPYHLWIIEK